MMQKEKGNVGDVLSMGFCLLAMTVIMVTYMDCVGLIEDKMEVGQLARKYILRMETVGGLLDDERDNLTLELKALGVTDIDYAGTTMDSAGYGKTISLHIKGKLRGEYDFEEHRSSTAKN